MQRLQASVSAFAVLMWAVAGSVGGDRVFCVAADGHVAIESAIGRCCEDAPHKPGAPLEERGTRPLLTVEAQCCECLDIPLPGSIAPAANGGTAPEALATSGTAPLGCPSPPVAVALLPPTSGAPGPPPAPHPAGVQAHLRTIVLRC